MRTYLRPALILLLLLTLLTGGIYPLLVTGIAQAAFSWRANGSLLGDPKAPSGSQLIGQSYTDAVYFWSRPSATADAAGKPLPYNAAASSGSNLGPTNPALVDAVRERVAALRAADPGNSAPVPVDLVTTSASGLDPEISPAAAEYQVMRVARARKLDPTVVQRLVDQHTLGRDLGILGEVRVNVLELNLALDDPSQVARAANPPATDEAASTTITGYRSHGFLPDHR